MTKVNPIFTNFILPTKAKNSCTNDNVTESNFRLEKAKLALADAIAKEDYEKIFNYFGMKTTKSKKTGLLTLSDFITPAYNFYSELGIDVSKMLEKVEKIKGDAIFGDNIKSFGNLKYIGGTLRFPNMNVTLIPKDAGKLEYIGKGISYTFWGKGQAIKGNEEIDKQMKYYSKLRLMMN